MKYEDFTILFLQCSTMCCKHYLTYFTCDNLRPIKFEQESPAIADKPARRESLPKIVPIRRAYTVVADNTGLFIRLVFIASEICEIPRNSLKIQIYGVQGHPRSSILVSMESP